MKCAVEFIGAMAAFLLIAVIMLDLLRLAHENAKCFSVGNHHELDEAVYAVILLAQSSSASPSASSEA